MMIQSLLMVDVRVEDPREIAGDVTPGTVHVSYQHAHSRCIQGIQNEHI